MSPCPRPSIKLRLTALLLCQTNIFKYNQRRIATIKYLGELHYYRQVSSPVIFDVLWSLITFGHCQYP